MATFYILIVLLSVAHIGWVLGSLLHNRIKCGTWFDNFNYQKALSEQRMQSKINDLTALCKTQEALLDMLNKQNTSLVSAKDNLEAALIKIITK